MEIASITHSTTLGYNVDLKNPVKGFTKLHRASWLGNQDDVRSCLKTIPTNCKDADLRTPLHLAAAAGNTLIARILMENDLSFNDRDACGKTPIMKAIECSHKGTVKIMIAAGADLTATDHHGNNAMHLAILGGHYDIAQLMLQYFPNCNVGNVDGVTPFHMIAEGIQVKLARKFIDYGASMDTVDKRGRTPLMLASKRGCFPMVALLLKNGANPRQKDNDGWAPLDYASIMGHTQVSSLLQKYISGEIVVDTTKGTESSSSDEEEGDIQTFLGKTSQRVVPIRIESQSMFLKRQRRPSFETKKRCEETERKEGVRRSDGSLLPMPDIVAAMQRQATKLGDIHEWVIKHEQIIDEKRKDYEQLRSQARKLWEQRKKLLEKLEEQKKKSLELQKRQQHSLNIKEAECLQQQISVLREGLAELREDHSRAVTERDELQNILNKGHEINKVSSDSMELKALQLLKENEVLHDKLQEMQILARNVTNGLTSKCKMADTLVQHLKVLLRGTFKLLGEKHGEIDKVMKEVDEQQGVIDNTRDCFSIINGENVKVGRSIDEVDARMKSIRKYLSKVHKEMEDHPFSKSLRDAGIMDEEGEIGESAAKKEKGKRKKSHHELEPDAEIQKLADRIELGSVMSSTASNVPTVCQSTLENVRYSWLENDNEDSFEVGENDLQLLEKRLSNEAVRLSARYSKGMPNDADEGKTTGNGSSTHLEAKRHSVATKYSK